MAKNYYIIIGNGFTIDLLNHIKKTDEINVSNLFDNGELVPWPSDDQKGFLSYKYCPNLWTLGARPNMHAEEAMALIEGVITCANMLNKNTDRDSKSIYINAYRELVPYLKSLFIYYDKKIDIPANNDISNWPWAQYLNQIYNSTETNKIHIVTFNYDIWLERILSKLNLRFSISQFEQDNEKIVIYKPHGSISFSYKVKKDKLAYEIDYSSDSNDGEISEFEISYDNLSLLDSINAIIPPAGDSSRLDYKWAKAIRDNAKDIAKNITVDDEVIICGLSYWHVDRLEIDSILTNINPDIKNIKLINPNTPSVFNAIITTLFKNVIFFKNSKSLQ